MFKKKTFWKTCFASLWLMKYVCEIRKKKQEKAVLCPFIWIIIIIIIIIIISKGFLLWEVFLLYTLWDFLNEKPQGKFSFANLIDVNQSNEPHIISSFHSKPIDGVLHTRPRLAKVKKFSQLEINICYYLTLIQKHGPKIE